MELMALASSSRGVVGAWLLLRYSRWFFAEEIWL